MRNNITTFRCALDLRRRSPGEHLAKTQNTRAVTKKSKYFLGYLYLCIIPANSKIICMYLYEIFILGKLHKLLKR